MARPNKNPDKRDRVPAWGRSFLSPGEYAEFCQRVTEALEPEGPAVELDLQGGWAILRHPGGEGRTSLANLARLCKAHRRADWTAVIAEFFASMRRIHEDPLKILGAIERFEDARARLKVRLHPEGMLEQPAAPALVLRKVADGIAGMLVCDLGFANISLPAEVARRWKVPDDELWSIATENVRAEGPLPVTEGAALGLPLDVLTSRSNYAATHALFFQDYLPESAGYGALVGVPQRHALVRHVIRDAGVLQAAHLMIQVIDDWYEQGPGEISPELYWWRRGELVALPLVRLSDSVVLVAEDEFGREVLARVLKGS